MILDFDSIKYKPRTLQRKHRRGILNPQERILTLTVIVIFIVAVCLLVPDTNGGRPLGQEYARISVNRNLKRNFFMEKGQGCEIPVLDPFAEEMTQFDAQVRGIECAEPDWVKCYNTVCRVIFEDLIKNGVYCTYEDLKYVHDYLTVYDFSVLVIGNGTYNLTIDDYVKINCALTSSKYNREKGILEPSWSGYGYGINHRVSDDSVSASDGISLIVLGFDSVSKNMFIRKLPKSTAFLKTHMNATFFNGYNIVGDGTAEALYPFLTGKFIIELPEVQNYFKNSEHLQKEYFIFHHARKAGYRTLFYEDSPHMQTFQKNVRGFLSRPVDHYLRPFTIADHNKDKSLCCGDTPWYKLQLNLTHQFLQLDGKKMGFNFMVDVSHDDFKKISIVDDDLLWFLEDFVRKGHMKDTMLVIMSDHGPRFDETRKTYQGRLEERMPMLAIVTPEKLLEQRPEVKKAFELNVNTLATPFDMHTTMLDVLSLRNISNPFTVPGSKLTRGVSLLQPIPRNRTCSEAGIEPHYCTCFKWGKLEITDPMYARAAMALVDFINSLIEKHMSLIELCATRKLLSVEWVMKHVVNKPLMSYKSDLRRPNSVAEFGPQVDAAWDLYQARIVVSPGSSQFEGTLSYYKENGEFIVDERQISRTDPYGKQPHCIEANYPQLAKYCYCTLGIHKNDKIILP